MTMKMTQQAKIVMVTTLLVAGIVAGLLAFNTSNAFAQFADYPPIPADVNCGATNSGTILRSGGRHNPYREEVENWMHLTVCDPHDDSYVYLEWNLPAGTTEPNGSVILSGFGVDNCILQGPIFTSTVPPVVPMMTLGIRCDVNTNYARYNSSTGLHSIYLRARMPMVDDIRDDAKGIESVSAMFRMPGTSPIVRNNTPITLR